MKDEFTLEKLRIVERIANVEATLESQIQRMDVWIGNQQKITEKLDLIIFGDANGNKGLVRKQDSVEGRVKSLENKIHLAWVGVAGVIVGTFKWLLHKVFQ